MALKDIKTKIGATNRMHKVTRAMEAVSAVKMRKSQESAFASRPYAHAALSILTRLASTGGFRNHSLMSARPVKRIALVVLTSDKGLAGSLNSSVLRLLQKDLTHFPKESVVAYTYGKKATEFLERREYTIARSVENKSDTVNVQELHDLSCELIQAYERGEIDEVRCYFSNFRSTFEQVASVRTLLPLTLAGVGELVKEITPVRGKWSKSEIKVAPPHYTAEPTSEEVLAVLLPDLVSVSLYHMLLEGKASEHSARMVAMKNARDKSKEVARALTRHYNKLRQAAITREVCELVGGREALAKA